MLSKSKSIGVICIIYLVIPGAVSWAQDEESESESESESKSESQWKDTPYLSGMPNYRITDAADKEFDEYGFYNGKDCTTIEGRKYQRGYTFNENEKQAGELQICRNYLNAIKNMGGAIVFDGRCPDAECATNCSERMLIGKVKKGGNEVWIEVAPFNGGGDYSLIVVAKEAMKQDVTANDILNTLNRDGHIALYINFDTGKSTIKPESKTIIEQIVQMLKANPELNVSVEGHTDNVGNPKSNKTLSDDRAKAVVKAIAAQDIDIKRLSAVGHGQYKPIADNKTEEGRANNRRVELVKK